MPHRDIVVIGGSTGAIEALRTLAAGLPADFPAAVFVALHTSPESPGIVDRIIQHVSSLPVMYAREGDRIRPATIVLAPVDRHLLIKRDHVRTTQGPRENRFRPAVDPLFRTAATAHGPRVIGIVLSGAQDDGAAGLGLIKSHGGIAIVQDPQLAIAPGMPQAAIEHVSVDHVVGVGDMAHLLERLVRQPVEEGRQPVNSRDARDIAEGGSDNIHFADSLGPPSPFTCPECGGALWEFREGQLIQFQCHIGHRYSGDTLESAQSEALDHALWAGLRALEESSELRRRMARHARDRGMAAIAARYEAHSRDSEERADVIRRALMPGARSEPPDFDSEGTESAARLK